MKELKKIIIKIHTSNISKLVSYLNKKKIIFKINNSYLSKDNLIILIELEYNTRRIELKLEK